MQWTTGAKTLQDLTRLASATLESSAAGKILYIVDGL